MKTLGTMKRFATKLWRDERGAEGIEKLMIIAAVVLPVLALLLIFKDEVYEYLTEKWEEIKGG